MVREPALKFVCPSCGCLTASRVLETRLGRRRRECAECQATFTTREIIVPRDREWMHRPTEPLLPFDGDEGPPDSARR